jgi:predicted  nucleic acid-binding Zn-ribbon protein
MACLDHVCVVCGYAWMDNQRASSCPECGGRVTNDVDDDPDEEPERELEEDDA